MLSQQPTRYSRFDFDLPAAMLSQLVAAFDALPIGHFTQEILAKLDPEPGVYQLYLSGKLMYVGKAVISLPENLRVQLIRLESRNGFVDLGFKCLTVSRNWLDYADVASLAAYYQ